MDLVELGVAERLAEIDALDFGAERVGQGPHGNGHDADLVDRTDRIPCAPMIAGVKARHCNLMPSFRATKAHRLRKLQCTTTERFRCSVDFSVVSQIAKENSGA